MLSKIVSTVPDSTTEACTLFEYKNAQYVFHHHSHTVSKLFLKLRTFLLIGPT